MIDFPASPTEGQTFVVGGVTYTFTGGAWVATGGTPPADLYVLRAGDTMDGGLALPASEPSDDFMAAHRLYVARKSGLLSLVAGPTPLTIPNAAVTILTFSNAIVNDAGAWNSGQGGRLTAPAWATRVELTAMCQWGAASGTGRVLLIHKNGVNHGRDDRGGYSVSGQSYTYVDSCVGGDYYQMAVFQDSGANMALNGGTPTRFAARFFM